MPRTTDSRIVGTHAIIIDAMILIVCVRRLANMKEFYTDDVMIKNGIRQPGPGEEDDEDNY